MMALNNKYYGIRKQVHRKLQKAKAHLWHLDNRMLRNDRNYDRKVLTEIKINYYESQLVGEAE